MKKVVEFTLVSVVALGIVIGSINFTASAGPTNPVNNKIQTLQGPTNPVNP